MSTAQKQGQATSSGFHLITIPFADVAATIPTRPSNTPTSRAGAGNNLHADETLCCTASFNTHHHSAAELAAALRPPSASSPNPHFSPHDHHHHTDIAITTSSTDIDHPAFAFSTWLAPLIAPSGSSNQGCSAVVVRLPRAFVADVLLPAHSRWLRTSALPEGLVAALLDDWPGVRDEVERAVAAAAAAAASAAGRAAAGGGGGAGGRGAFVRLDACSTKDSALHDAKTPVRSAREVVRAVAGSMRAAGALGRWLEATAGGAGGSRAVALCVVPWDARMDAGNEFRVFVPPPPATVRRGKRQEAAAAAAEGFDDGELKISAISQYRWCEPLKLQEGLGMDVVGMVEEGAERLLRKILEVAGWLEWRDKEGKGMLEVLRERGFVFDVAVMPQKDGGHAVQLVELNPFGATTGCGSVLFHWINDARVLYGLDRREFRVALDR
ncbi:hypothetical protein DIS24_g1835 [Lasiodiplodia hormozganensis]|uniref:Cell division cycle protein 123 n=1 Tax=Lasiodiplodia hormozganensis TaxID=869390 RepID=A0AA40D5S1_9PEZI|nr:hypothetical protein DIS24_g1835 [Lasiodiplodia hormozganensis]